MHMKLLIHPTLKSHLKKGILICLFLVTACSANDPENPKIIDDDSELVLRTEFGSVNSLNVVTDDIFAIWWDPAFNHEDDLETMFSWFKEIRTDCLENLGMADPPNPPAGFFYNIYIHHGEQDILPNGWANGQGTDVYGMPYLTLPNGAHLEYGNVLHEAFHVFQYSANSPGFAYSGDSQWYVESAAQWYAAQNDPGDIYTFIEAGAISANPHLALWHSFSNEAPGDPTDWLFQVRQYGMHTYLYYLTEFAEVDSDIISGGFYMETDLSPQKYHYEEIGGDQLRAHFSDWAARNTGGFDYLSEEQLDRALLEVELAGDPENLHPFVLELSNDNVSGVHIPPLSLRPRGWGYNVIKINNIQSSSYTISLTGDEMGSEGASAHFEGRIVIKGNSVTRYLDMEMANSLSGTATVNATGTENEVYVVIAALPEHFEGNQTYNYSLEISKD
jgi:hypothetical protein